MNSQKYGEFYKYQAFNINFWKYLRNLYTSGNQGLNPWGNHKKTRKSNKNFRVKHNMTFVYQVSFRDNFMDNCKTFNLNISISIQT